ncbi:MAG: hypothetical protein V1902_03505 [Candidatus Falkowbacteria bacterium]
MSRPNPKVRKINIIVTTLLGAVIVSLSAGYLVQMNKIATIGYSIKELDAKSVELVEYNKKAEVEVIKAQSISNLDEKVAMLNMVPVGQIKYLDGSTFVMAR